MEKSRLLAATATLTLLTFSSGCVVGRLGEEGAPGLNGVSNARSYCEHQAKNYITRNNIDRLWREHEYYRQYRQCYYDQTRKNQTS